MSDYEQIDCAIYSRYELAILQRQRLQLRWRADDGMTHLAALLPRDLETCRGEEFLHADLPDGQSVRIRLDHILSCTFTVD